MDTGLVYQALKDRQVDVGARVRNGRPHPGVQLRRAEGRQGLLPAVRADAGRAQAGARRESEARRALNALSAKLDDATMARLNASVDVDKKTVEEVAQDVPEGAGPASDVACRRGLTERSPSAVMPARMHHAMTLTLPPRRSPPCSAMSTRTCASISTSSMPRAPPASTCWCFRSCRSPGTAAGPDTLRLATSARRSGSSRNIAARVGRDVHGVRADRGRICGAVLQHGDRGARRCDRRRASEDQPRDLWQARRRQALRGRAERRDVRPRTRLAGERA